MIIVTSVRITVFDTRSRFEVCFSCANGVLRPLKLTGSFYLSRSGSNLWGEILRPLKGPLRFKALQRFEKGTRELLEGTEDIPDVRSSISGLQMISFYKKTGMKLDRPASWQTFSTFWTWRRPPHSSRSSRRTSSCGKKNFSSHKSRTTCWGFATTCYAVCPGLR